MKTFNTIQDMENFYYGPAYEMMKANEVDWDSTGVRNIIFGAKLWEQVNLEANVFGVLPKKPWDKSGYRAITAASSTASPGVAENSTMPAATEPTFAEVSVEPKESAAVFDMSTKLQAVEGSDDVVRWAELQTYFADEFSNRLNRALCTNVTTLANDNVESIDRICSSYAEVTNCADVDAGDSDIYGIDRDADLTWNNAYVSHNSDTNRTLSLSLIDTIIENVRPFWKNPAITENKVFVTGYDTLSRWSRLIGPKERFDASMKVSFDVNGIKTVGDKDAGFEVASYKGIPIIVSNNVVQDSLSRIYLLDLDHLWFGIAKPTLYTESEEYLHINKFVKRGLFHMIGELVCTKFRGQGKVRDLA